jgi:hypothetical protein
MDRNLDAGEVRRLASLELNLLNYSRAFPLGSLEGARLDVSTPIYDLNGELLFHRLPIQKNDSPWGYADVAAHTALGAPLLAVAPAATWDEQSVLGEAREAFLSLVAGSADPILRKSTYDEIRIVAYSFPKIAVQFLSKKKEVAMLEYVTWTPVPPAPASPDRRLLQPGNFERWSLLDELDEKRKTENERKFASRIKGLNKAELTAANVGLVSSALVDRLPSLIRLSFSYDLHYSPRLSDHHVCYELRGQETSVWCVGASVQMLLDFYRYNYTQSQIATQLGLGTLTNPNGLPYSQVGAVVTQLEAMSSNALAAVMITNPVFSDFTGEVSQNRPMISFIPGHSRTVAGYTETLFLDPEFGPFQGLLVYDPWPPNAGVITRWENFATQTYQYAYKAQVSTI